MLKRLLLIAATVATVSSFSTNAPAQSVTYFSDEAAWITAVENTACTVQTFETTPDGVAMANEVSTPPGLNAALGGQLTFESIASLSLDFELIAPNEDSCDPGRALVYDDNEQNFPSGERLISIGDIDGVPSCPSTLVAYQDDDFTVHVTPVAPDVMGVYAIGVEVVGNDLVPGEELRVFNEAGVLVATFSAELPDDNSVFNPVFMGVLAAEPLSRIEFEEGDDGDDIAIRDFWFGVLLGPVATEQVSVGDLKSRFQEEKRR